MPGREAIDAKDAPAAARQMVERGAAHDAEPANDRVEMSHRPKPCCEQVDANARPERPTSPFADELEGRLRRISSERPMA